MLELWFGALKALLDFLGTQPSAANGRKRQIYIVLSLLFVVMFLVAIGALIGLIAARSSP